MVILLVHSTKIAWCRVCSCRLVLQVMPKAEVLTAAILKVAAGTPMLAASLHQFLPDRGQQSCLTAVSVHSQLQFGCSL